MQRYHPRQILIAKLAALALSVLCFLQAQVRAQETTYNLIFPSVGVASDQRVSFTLFNPNGMPVRAQAQVRQSGGMQVGLVDGSVRFISDSISIQAGAFYSFVIDHSDISMPCYENTCRKQILPSVSVTSFETIKPVVASMEIIDVRDGTSNTVFTGEVIPSKIPFFLLLTRHAQSSGGVGKDVLIGGSGSDYLMTFVPGRKGLVTVYNPSRLVLAENGSYEESKSISGRVKIFDVSGNLIAQSPELVIPPGKSNSFSFNPDAFPLLGEPGANRTQVRIKPFFTYRSERLPAPQGDDLLLTSLVSFEVVDNSTGKTVVLSGQQCLVFYLGGI